MLRCSPVLGSFHVLQPGGGVKFLEGTHFYHDPGGLDIFCIWSGGQEIFLPLGVAHVKFSRWEGGYWKGVT